MNPTRYFHRIIRKCYSSTVLRLCKGNKFLDKTFLLLGKFKNKLRQPPEQHQNPPLYVYMPPNTTFLLQPMDQRVGYYATFKRYYFCNNFMQIMRVFDTRDKRVRLLAVFRYFERH